jgi:hypothetical protein
VLRSDRITSKSTSATSGNSVLAGIQMAGVHQS